MRFLIVDDDPEFRRVLRYHVEVEWPDAPISEHQPSSTGCRPETVPIGGADIVLLGYPLAGEEALHWLKALRRRADCPPVLLFADPSDEALAVDAIKAGATGYFPKSKIRHRRLVDAIQAETGARDAGATVRSAESSGTAFVGAGAFSGGRRHRFLAKLHSSDLSSVYLAEREEGGERVVFKVVRHVPDSGDARLFDRFLQEYEIVAKVRHPNVVRIFDLGIADDHGYIVMEHFESGSLADRIGEPLPAERALDYVRQIGHALAAIHDGGVLHRDLKPANVMFRADDTLALIDFGLAKQLRLQAAITGTGQIFGTPYYMSPEQGHAERTDARSDLYSLGCMLYEMLTGEKPFLATTAMGVIYKHAHSPRPRLPADLEHAQETLDRLLAIDPAERYQNAAELLAAL